MSAGAGRRLVRALACLGICFTLLGLGSAARGLVDWYRSERIQHGPHVVATVRAGGTVSGHREVVTLSYRDRAGAPHLLTVRYPLGLAPDVVPGEATTVAYDPGHPGSGELADHPRHHWQSALLALGLTAFGTALWLRAASWVAAASQRAEQATLPHRHTVGGAAAAAALLFAIGRLCLQLVAHDPPQEVAFPPLPPTASAVHAARVTLPQVLRAPPPAQGPVVTPAIAEQVLTAAWPARDGALVRRDVATLRALEAGPALTVDIAGIDQGAAPNRADPKAADLGTHRVYVPRQTSWPAHFMAQVTTTAVNVPWLEIMVFQRRGPTAPWQVVYDTGLGGVGSAPQPHPATLDAQGYDVATPVSWMRPRDAVPDLARYWQSWVDSGAAPTGGPAFAPGLWTTGRAAKIAGKQDTRARNRLLAHYTYDERPAGETWVYGVYGGADLVCSPLTETVTWQGPAHQDQHRQKWGRDLAPGVYRTVTSEFLSEPCVIVPAGPAPLAPLGAETWLVGTRGVRAR